MRKGFSILLNIKFGPLWRAFLGFCKCFAYFKSFLVSRLSVINNSLNMLAIVVVLLQFLFWIKMTQHYNNSKVFCLLPKYIEMSWLYMTWFSHSCKAAIWWNKLWYKVGKRLENSCLFVRTKRVKFIFAWRISFAICCTSLLLFLPYNDFKNSDTVNIGMKLKLSWLIDKFTLWKS